MASQAKRDPLSRYFKDLNDSDLDSDESEEENSKTDDSKQSEPLDLSHNDIARKCDKKTSSVSDNVSSSSNPQQTNKNNLKKLPSAHECLTSKNSPEFLKLNKKQEVNWDTSLKCLDDGTEAPIGEYKSNAVPPPPSYEPLTDPGIKVVDSQGRKRESPNDQGDESSPTKAYRVEKQDS